MPDEAKTKAQLIAELTEMRQRVAELETQLSHPPEKVTTAPDITKRKLAEEELRQYHEHLEELVAERTAELLRANEQLLREIAERQRAEEILAEERNLSRTLIDNLPDHIYVKDTESRYVTSNLAHLRFVGATAPDEVVGKTAFDFYPPELAAQYYADDQMIFQSGQPVVNREELTIGPEGIKKWLLTTKVPLPDSQGEIVGLVGIGRDITEHKRLEQQLLQAQKMEAIGALAGGIAHDFNNMLTAIMGYAGLTMEVLSPAHPIYNDIQSIQKIAQRAADLTRQLLAFARRQLIQPKILNLNDLILDMSKMLRRLIGEDIELVTLPTPDLWLVKVDPGQFEQVLVNLVVNARDAMPGGGKLIIETVNVTLDQDYARQHAEVIPGPYVMLAITDNGYGMTEEVKAHLFEPFFTTKEVGKGTGLGLATCFGIIKQNRGHIRVYSEPDQGTTFKIYLPRVEETTDPWSNTTEVKNLPAGQETILLVEDEEAVRELVIRILRQQGYTVLEAANGIKALSLAQEHSETEIHLLLTDVVMPQMGGKILADRLKVLRPNIKVLFISGYTDNAMVHNSVLESGIAFLQKPFSPFTLAHKVRKVLDA